MVWIMIPINCYPQATIFKKNIDHSKKNRYIGMKNGLNSPFKLINNYFTPNTKYENLSETGAQRLNYIV